MRSRKFRILFLSFLCLWLGVIVPGHERGQIVLPGRPHVAMRSCCAMRGGSLTRLDFSDPANRKSKPTREERKRCAMCQLIATLQHVQPTFFIHPPMGLLAISEPQHAIGVSHPAFAGPILGRAPPVV